MRLAFSFFFFFTLIPLFSAPPNYDQKQDTINEYFFNQAIDLVDNDSIYQATKIFNDILENTDSEKDFALYSYKIGNYFVKYGVYDLAGGYLYNALFYYESVEISKEYVWNLSAVAELKQRIGDTEESLKLLNQALEISKQLNNDMVIGDTYNNIGAAYFDMGDYNLALFNYHKALNYPLDSLSIVNSNINIGSTYRHLGDYDKALSYLLAAKDICANNFSNSKKEAHVLMVIGISYISIKNYQEGFEYLKQAEEIISLNRTSNLLYVLYYNMALSYVEINDYENSTNYLLKHDSIKNNVLSLKHIQSAKHFEIKYNMMKVEAEIEKQKLLLKNQNAILVIEMLIIIVLIAFLIFYYFQKNRFRELYKKLVEKNIDKIEQEEPKQQNNEVHKIDDKTEQYLLLADEIIELFETEKIFKSNKLSTSILAEKLDTNKTYISKAINIKFGKNFNTILNEFRINEAIKMIMLEEYTLYTISYISTEVGFNSISVFNANFKKITGLTPSVFIKSTKEIKAEKSKAFLQTEQQD